MKDPIRVAIADDNREFCGLLQQYLIEQGDFAVVGVVHDGAQALDLVFRAQPDVLILDVIMPHLDGIGVLERLGGLGLDRRPKVVMLTAFGHEHITQRAVELGADYYILKPFGLEVLADRVRQLCATEYRSPAKGPVRVVARRLDQEVTSIIRDVGVPAHIKGYLYLREAILMVVERIDLLGAVTKELYPNVAIKYRTTPSRVERAIRHAIEVAWEKTDAPALTKTLGLPTGGRRSRPTNSEFIAAIADRVRLQADPRATIG